MIEFREKQNKIYIGKNKITKSLYKNHIDFHLIYSKDDKSGYDGKFVRIITFDNIYDFDTIKDIQPNNFEEDFFNIMYFENGGYLFDKKTF